MTPRGTRIRGRAHAIEALAGLAAIVAIVAVAAPWLLGPRSDGRPAVPVTATSPATGSANPSDASVALTHAEKWYLAFDYPAAWKLVDQNALSMADPNPLVHFTFVGSDWATTVRAVGFVGSGSASDACVAGDPNAVLECTTNWVVPGDSVEVRFLLAGDSGWNGISAIDGRTLPGFAQTTVAGLPALFRQTTNSVPASPGPVLSKEEVVPGADEVLSWLLPSQHSLDAVFAIDAVIRGPNVAGLDAQVRAMMASLRWSPVAYSLPTDPAALQAASKQATAAALAWLKTSMMGKVWQSWGSHVFDCFPTEPGASSKATITNSLVHPLTKPLPVTCATAIAPNAMGGLTLSLTHSWAAGPGYAAGSSTGRWELAPDGTVQEIDYYDGWHRDVYPHQGSWTPG